MQLREAYTLPAVQLLSNGKRNNRGKMAVIRFRTKTIFTALFIVSLLLNARGSGTGAFAAPDEAVTAFLFPPYPGTASQESVFDHTSPNYVADKRVVTFNGAEARKNCPQPPPPGTPPPEPGVCDAGYGIYWSYSLGSWLAYDGHDGIDYGLSYRPLYAAADTDQVIYSGWWDPQNHKVSLGLYVRLHHPNGYSTSYGHMSAVAVQGCSSPGCVFFQHGEWIGFSGNTGNSTGPHLHLRVVNPAGKAVDPYGWTGSGADPWSANQRESLWVSNPSLIYYGAEIFPSGNPLDFPAAPGNGIIVDDGSGGFSESPASCWNAASASSATGGSMRFAKARVTAPTCSGQWAFPQGATPGQYAVYIRVPAIHATSEGAFYDIQHNAEVDRVYINQVVYPNRFYASDGWLYAGKYNFNSAGDEFIELTNQTKDEPGAVSSLEVGADSVQFVYVGDATPTPPTPVTLTPSFTPTVTRTPTVTNTPTSTRTSTATKTPTSTRTPTVTKTSTNTRTPTKTVAPSRTPTAARPPTPPHTRRPTATPLYYKINVYFANRNRLNANTPPYEVTGQRWAASSANQPEAALKEYFKGPGSTERSLGYIALYNGFTGYSKLEVNGDVAKVHLNGACTPSGKNFTIADLITLNLKQFGNIRAVKIYDQFGQTQNPDGAGDSEPICLDPSFTPTSTVTNTPTPSKTPTNTRTPTTTRTPSRTPTATRTPRPTATPLYTKINVYFVDQKKYNAGTPPYEVAGVRWAKSSANFPQLVLDEYFKGPGFTEKNTYKWIAIYSGATGYSKFEVADGIVRVYLRGECNSSGAAYTIADVLRVNLKQFPAIQYVKIYDRNGNTQAPDGQSDSIPACLEP